ncbi:hypothetical protein BgAZ_205660 [Babesia gibsoni]|uniref:Coiled-coil domain-containing protein 43 n=1 Tax=Babesia gibsoni TaxID=33632 RepID=A0AAD8LJ35_BABGI|nr:hypothetical protein BgAZ_205660 [Babesia gibsoni]
MAAILLEWLPKIGLDADEDLSTYLLEIIEVEGVESCVEWLESATNGDHSNEIKAFVNEVYASITNDKKREQEEMQHKSQLERTLDNSVDEIIRKLNCNKLSHRNGTTNGKSANGKMRGISGLDNHVKRDIVQKYASVEVKTLHLDDDGNFYSSGVAVDNNDGEDANIPANTNVARVRQQQNEIRLSQKQKHQEEQEKARQQKIDKQKREEMEKLRCQKKERHK